MSKPTIVCLCGSTRFSEAFHTASLKETLAGNIVLSIGVDTKSDEDLMLAGELTDADKKRLDELHLRKIDLADEILVLNVGGYIGESTSREICYAYQHNKRIRWLEPEDSDFWQTQPTQGNCHCGEPITWFRTLRSRLTPVAGCERHIWTTQVM